MPFYIVYLQEDLVVRLTYRTAAQAGSLCRFFDTHGYVLTIIMHVEWATYSTKYDMR